jgi:hypothetical protein
LRAETLLDLGQVEEARAELATFRTLVPSDEGVPSSLMDRAAEVAARIDGVG